MLLKVIKEDNLGDTNKLYLTLHEVDKFHLENCKMGLKERKMYRLKKIKNKEEKYKKHLIGWGHTVHSVWGWKQSGGKTPELASCLGIG